MHIELRFVKMDWAKNARQVATMRGPFKSIDARHQNFVGWIRGGRRDSITEFSQTADPKLKSPFSAPARNEFFL